MKARHALSGMTIATQKVYSSWDHFHFANKILDSDSSSLESVNSGNETPIFSKFFLTQGVDIKLDVKFNSPPKILHSV